MYNASGAEQLLFVLTPVRDPSITLCRAACVLPSCSRALTQFVVDGIDEKLRAKQNSLFVLIFAFAIAL